MVLSSGDISSKIYRRKVRDDIGDFSLDHQALLIFMELDGKATLGALAGKIGLSMGSIRELISNLLELGLIEKIEKQIIPVDSDFFRYLVEELAQAVGPIASVIIEDEVHDLGHDVKTFPSYLVTELVDILAGEIRREDKKSVFIKNMINIIRSKGYVDT